MNICCNRPPVFIRKYEGASFCEKHFCESLEKKVAKTVGKYKLVAQDDVIAFGLSGGKDSSVVLSLLAPMLKKRGIPCVAITVDEGIAGYRSKTLNKAKTLCNTLGVKHVIVSYQKEWGKSLDKKLKEVGSGQCTFCGVARRYLLNKAARKAKATKLCVGHNLDDEAQAVMMNMLRGDIIRAGRLETKTGGGKGFVPRIKPLRFIPEREIALYAILKKLPFSDEECPYARGFRFDVRDFLNQLEYKHPGTKFTLLETYEKLAPALKEFSLPKGSLRTCTICKEPSSQAVCKACELWRERSL